MLQKGLREEAVNVVVTIGPDGDLDRFAPQPDNVRIEHYIAQNTLLPHCDVVTRHLGSSSQSASLLDEAAPIAQRSGSAAAV
jgi:UDP:flavonoid glycosyltransferase YjiC (YdhE family)